MSENVRIVVNGEMHQVPAGISVTGLLAMLGLAPNRVAIERNMDILSKTEWDKTLVVADDRYEIVHLVGGG